MEIFEEVRQNVMVNGLPGRMARKIAEEVINTPGLTLMWYSLTGQDIQEAYVTIEGRTVALIKPGHRDNLDGLISKTDVAVDFTHPDAAIANAEYYCSNKINFVMGTTGADYNALEERVKSSEVIAVIAPNMAKQVVAFQAMMKYAADSFPDAFKGYSLEITESHQKGKADTSGTAKAMVTFFNKLGIPFEPKQIKMIREPEEQREINVPEEAITSHAWHTYTLRLPDGNAMFSFTHNINGVGPYVKGTIDAIRFLGAKSIEGKRGAVYSMMDVLQNHKL